MFTRRRSTGFSLIEVVVFIVVLGIAFVGMLILFNRVTSASVDPMVRKQALAIASSLLEEIELHAFTYCDPDDPKVYAANSTADCTTVEVTSPGGPEAGPPAETRYDVPRFDNVNDYNGFQMGSGKADPNIRTATAASISDLANYSVSVTVVQIAANELRSSAPGLNDVPTTEGLRITVTTTHVPTGITTSLQGYRVRYAPNSP